MQQSEGCSGGILSDTNIRGAVMYAGRKRRKPVQRSVKPPSNEGTKSNPSKRHRDRLNGELERLASLLPFPEEVTASLDKLSILRLSVSYLRAKNFFSAALSKRNGFVHKDDEAKPAGELEDRIPEGELLLQALNGFVLVVTAGGTIFYSSHTIQDYLGFHQTDVMHQSVYELVHTEDQQELRRNLHWALNPSSASSSTSSSQDSPNDADSESSSSLVTYNPEHLPPENSSFLERGFVCRFRCLLDNSSGFLALNLQGRLKFLQGQSQKEENGENPPMQLALFTIATPLQPPSILEIRTKNMIFRTKHKLDFTPMACDAKGKIVLGYTEAELRVRGSGYQFIHAADMLHCAENHVRMIKTGESGLTVFRLLTKENRWKWVQANARLVYKNSKPDYIIATQRPLLDEEGGEHLRKRSMHLPFTYATGEALLYQSNHPLGFLDEPLHKNGSKSKKSRSERMVKDGLDPGSLLGALMSQDQSVYVCQPAVEPKLSFQNIFGEQLGFTESKAHRGWNESGNAVVPSVSEASTSLDPLLATLDSLVLEGQVVGDPEEGTCSNGELFGALEGLGLSAEDLELLLLDERMIRVEMDSEHIPSLDDLLTNDEILSYIYNTIEGKNDPTEQGGQVPPDNLPTTQTNPITDNNLQMTFQRPNAVGQGPIIQLSQQMQQHLTMQSGKASSDWGQHSTLLANSVVNGGVHESNHTLPNGHWSTQGALVNAGMQMDPYKAFFKSNTSHTNEEFQQTHPYIQQPGRIHNQLSQQCHGKQKASNLNGLCGFPSADDAKSLWQDYGFSGGLSNNACLDNSQKHMANTALDMDFSMADSDNGDYTMSGGRLFGSQQHVPQSTVSSFQEMNHKLPQEAIPVPLAQVISSLSQCPPPNASLEQILGVAKPCRQLEHYAMVTASDIPHEASHSKMENGCILDSTYPAGCSLPNGNSVVPPVVQLPGPDPLSSLPDTPATGFYL
ncbi:aryl hydrocarbon receptor-like [Eucyclogobius newberryi]|uniref:aryl hydrocarbon receptor-like n=1 Tax=Eucyclogobius newberryi TaxID=166745 RepID=UPI003B593282